MRRKEGREEKGSVSSLKPRKGERRTERRSRAEVLSASRPLRELTRVGSRGRFLLKETNIS